MTVSLLSRFQGCLLLTLAGTDSLPGLQRWANLFPAGSYQGPLPASVWQGPDLRWQSPGEFYRWLVVLALWHHENAVGFSTDLGRSALLFAQQCPTQALSTGDQLWLQLWQRLLTLILSERFTLAQLPDLWRPDGVRFLLGPLPLPAALSQQCQGTLGAIALALEHYQAPVFPASPEPPLSLAQALPWSFYHWAALPAQPRLSLGQCQGNPLAALGLPFTAALSGGFNGEAIIRQAIAAPPSFVSGVNQFAQRHFLAWAGGLCPQTGALTSTAPLGMQRRSGLKLISQRDYGHFS